MVLVPREPRPEAALWTAVRRRDIERKPKAVLQALLVRVVEGTQMRLYDAIEQGVPTEIVLLLAAAFGKTTGQMMEIVGVSETTFRRKEEAGEPLPEVAGHRVMALLRLFALLQRLLTESGDPEGFDLESWFGLWLGTPVYECGGRTPGEMLRNPEGQRMLETLLERMRGGLVA